MGKAEGVQESEGRRHKRQFGHGHGHGHGKAGRGAGIGRGADISDSSDTGTGTGTGTGRMGTGEKIWEDYKPDSVSQVSLTHHHSSRGVVANALKRHFLGSAENRIAQFRSCFR